MTTRERFKEQNRKDRQPVEASQKDKVANDTRSVSSSLGHSVRLPENTHRVACSLRRQRIHLRVAWYLSPRRAWAQPVGRPGLGRGQWRCRVGSFWFGRFEMSLVDSERRWLVRKKILVQRTSSSPFYIFTRTFQA